jgi:sodium-independent sulfate anion transporter 11
MKPWREYLERCVEAVADRTRTKGGESIFSVTSADGYVENEPTVVDWFKDVGPGRDDVVGYVKSLFPAAGWLPRYNFRWALGDVIAGS